jgi:hypothetical protein
MVARELAGKCPVACPERVERGGGRSLDPRGRIVGQAALGDEALELAALLRGDGARACGIHHAHELARDDEQRAPHPEHAHESPLVVQGTLEVDGPEPARACPGREEHGDRVGRMERDHRAHRVEDVVRSDRRREAMAANEPCPSLREFEPAHGAGSTGRRAA